MDSEQQEQSNTTVGAQKGLKAAWELLPMSSSSLHRLCDKASAMSDPLRASEAFQSIPTFCPFGDASS